MKKIVIFTLVYSIILFLFHTILYKFNYNYESISNTLFYIGMISFFSGLISITNAQNVFIGFRYYFTQLFRNRNDTERTSYKEYRDQKLQTKFTYITVVILIVGIVFIIASAVLGILSYS